MTLEEYIQLAKSGAEPEKLEAAFVTLAWRDRFAVTHYKIDELEAHIAAAKKASEERAAAAAAETEPAPPELEELTHDAGGGTVV